MCLKTKQPHLCLRSWDQSLAEQVTTWLILPTAHHYVLAECSKSNPLSSLFYWTVMPVGSMYSGLETEFCKNERCGWLGFTKMLELFTIGLRMPNQMLVSNSEGWRRESEWAKFIQASLQWSHGLTTLGESYTLNFMLFDVIDLCIFILVIPEWMVKGVTVPVVIEFQSMIKWISY